MAEVRKAESSMSRCWNQINISICRQIRCQHCLRLLGAHPSCSGVFRVRARSFPVPSLLACVLVGVNLGSDEIIIIINRRREDIPYGRPISSKESGVSTNNIMSLLIPNSVMMWNTHFFYSSSQASTPEFALPSTLSQSQCFHQEEEMASHPSRYPRHRSTPIFPSWTSATSSLPTNGTRNVPPSVGIHQLLILSRIWE